MHGVLVSSLAASRPEAYARVAQMLCESGLKEAPAAKAPRPQPRPLPPPPPPAQMTASVVPLAAPAPLPMRGAGPRRAWGIFQQSPAAAESSRIKQQIFEVRAHAAMLGSACLQTGWVLLWDVHRATACIGKRMLAALQVLGASSRPLI